LKKRVIYKRGLFCNVLTYLLDNFYGNITILIAKLEQTVKYLQNASFVLHYNAKKQ
jgi:hypothetical protein